MQIMENLCLRLPGRRTSNEVLKFWLLNFSNFEIAFAKNSMEKIPGFKIYFERSDKVLLPHQYLWFEFSRQWNNGPLIFFFFFFFETWIKYFGSYFSFLIKGHLWVCYFWNYEPSNLKAELKADFCCKLVYILGKTGQDIVLNSYLRQVASSQVTSFWCF